jgi:hypothetical protein
MAGVPHQAAHHRHADPDDAGVRPAPAQGAGHRRPPQAAAARPPDVRQRIAELQACLAILDYKITNYAEVEAKLAGEALVHEASA